MQLHDLSLGRWKLGESSVEELGALSEFHVRELSLGRGLKVEVVIDMTTTFLFSPMAADEVHGDGQQPRTKAPITSEVVSGTVEPVERLLGVLTRQVVVAEVALDHGEDHRRIATEEQIERGLVATHVGRHQLLIAACIAIRHRFAGG